MAGWVLLDWDRKLSDVDSVEQLDTLLSSLCRLCKFPNGIANLVSPKGHTLSLGISGRLGCLNYIDADENAPSLTVLGDPSLTYENGGVVNFMYEDQVTEILRRNCVSVDVMLRAARHFYQTEGLPDWLTWEEV